MEQKQKIKPLIPKPLRPYVRRLIQPSPEITDRETRTMARTLAIFTFFSLIVYFIPFSIHLIFHTVHPLALRVYFWLSTVVVFITYLLSRSRHPKIGAWLLLITLSIGAPLSAIVFPTSEQLHILYRFMWSSAGLILGALFLSLGEFGLLVLINLGALTASWLLSERPVWFHTLLNSMLAEIVLLLAIAGSRRRQMRELLESENRFRELFESTLDALAIHDGERILAVNPAFETMFRVRAEDAIGRPPIDFVAPQARDEAYEAFLKSTQSPTNVVQSLGMRNDGTIFHAEAHMASVTYEGRRVYAISVRDISQRVAAHEALKAERNFLKQVMDAVSEPFFVLDANTHEILLANKAATPPNENGQEDQPLHCYQLSHHRETPCTHDANIKCLLEEVKQTGQSSRVEHVHFRHDGSTYIAAVHGYPLYDNEGKLSKVVIYTVDITRRKQAEERLRKLERAVEHSAHTIVITDNQGVIEYVNPAFTRVTGYTPEEALGRTPSILKSGKHPKSFYQNLWNTILKGEVFRGELINRRKSGELYWERISIAPVKDENGKVSHFVAVKEDITERKRLEEALQKARDEALQASKLKTQLLGNVSHDMRTPLGGIVGYTEMLLEEAFGPINDKQRQALMRIFQSTQQLIDFTNGLLNQAELESGRIRLHINEFDPRELLKVIPASAAIAEAKGVRVHTEIDPALPQKVSGDPYWIKQILANLLSNAVKFTEEGDIWIRLRAIDHEHWAIEVEDTGPGIPAEAQQHIFEPFRQADGSPTRRYKGSGLGLSIVSQLVALMDGEIQLESEVGKGSKFTVILPRQISPKEKQEEQNV